MYSSHRFFKMVVKSFPMHDVKAIGLKQQLKISNRRNGHFLNMEYGIWSKGNGVDLHFDLLLMTSSIFPEFQ